ncbi:MAG: SurA N-terminal domain-containing protein [Geminicoccaceae bacterium]
MLRSVRKFLTRGVACLAVAGALALPAAAPVRAQAVQGIAAVVNDDIISTLELADRVRLALISTNLPDDPDTVRRLGQQVLRALIDETLQKQEARRLNIQVTDAEIDQAVDRIAQRNNLTVEQLGKLLAQNGSSLQALRGQLATQISWFKVLGREVRPKVVVTEEQVDLAMARGMTSQTQPGNVGDREYLLSEIVLPVYSPDQEQQVLDDARKLVGDLRRGASFAGVAREVSVSPSRDGGGDLGWIPGNVVAEEIKAALQPLQAGQISDPVRTPAGVQIFFVREIRTAAGAQPVTPVPADRDEVRQRLMDEQMQKLAGRYLRDLRLNAFIDIRT